MTQDLAQIAPNASRAPAVLTRRHKAAIIVRFLMSEGADIPISELPEHLQQALTQAMGQLRLIDQTTLTGVVTEFTEELEAVGLSFPDGLAGALDELDGCLSPETSARLRREAGVRQKGDPWARVAGLENDALLELIGRESTEVAAVAISKLPVDKAATLLSLMPGTEARRIAYAVSKTEKVTPEAVYRIGLALATQIDRSPQRAFEAPPAKRLGEILDVSKSSTREEVLTGIEENDADFAQALRRAILTFSDLPERLKPLDAPTLAREVGDEMMATIIAGTDEGPDRDACDFLLENMSKRLADQLRETAREITPPDTAQTENAMAQAIKTLRRLQNEGEITLLVPGQGVRQN